MKKETIDALEAIYARLPKVVCQRKCQDYCGPLLVPAIEHARLVEKVGYLPMTAVGNVEIFDKTIKKYGDKMVAMKPADDMHCRLLTPVIGYCRVYPIRPLICRAWGVVDSPLLRCPEGCKPERWVSEEEFSKMLIEVIAVQDADAAKC